MSSLMIAHIFVYSIFAIGLTYYFLKIDPFHPILILTLFFIGTVIMRLFYIKAGLTAQGMMPYVVMPRDNKWIDQALLMSDINFIVGFPIAWKLSFCKKTREKCIVSLLIVKSCKKRAWIVLVISIAMSIIYVLLVGGIGTILKSPVEVIQNQKGKTILLQGFAILAFSCATILACQLYLIRSNEKQNIVMTIILLLISTIIMPLTSYRGIFYYPAIESLLVYQLAWKKVPYYFIGIIFLLVVLIFPFVSAVRYGDTGAKALKGDFSQISQKGQKMGGFSAVFVHMYARFHGFDGQAILLRKVSEGKIRVGKAELIKQMPLLILPRFIASNRPLHPSIVASRTIYYEWYGPRSVTCIQVSTPLFFYWQFGVLGIPIAGVVWGLIIGFCGFYYSRAKNGDFIALIIVLGSYFSFGLNSIIVTSNFITTIMENIFPIWLLLIGLPRVYGIARKANGKIARLKLPWFVPAINRLGKNE
jgi:hypothetical protein